jgi:predicted permease
MIENSSAAVRTIVPIFLLMGMGWLARQRGFMKAGDERVLNAYLYYFALPALFFVNLTGMKFTAENIAFMLAGIAPVFAVVFVYLLIYFVFKISRDMLYLLILTTVFGSLAFYGIPFVSFAFPTREAEFYATLSISSISIVSVSISITVLEFYRIEQASFCEGVKNVAYRLSRNPMIISIAAAMALSMTGFELPSYVSKSLHMMGSTTSTVAIFMLGVFLYGRTYTNLLIAFKLSLLRMILLPVIAIGSSAVFDMQGIQKSILVLMHSMPIAISMIVLSERYNFYKEVIASLILISSIGAGIYLNVWLMILGN